MRMRWIGRYDRRARIFRMVRVTWTRGRVGDGRGYSAKLSLALCPRIIGWRRTSYPEWMLTAVGLRLHYQRSYGGNHA